MIPIPKTIKVGRNHKTEEALLAKTKAWLTRTERGEGIHASGLLDPRQEYFRLTDPQALTDREAGLFLPGQILHAFVTSVVDGRPADLDKTDTGGQYSEEFGIWYSPDLDINNIIREIKTSRAHKEPKSIEEIDIYIEQALVYMALKNRTLGQIWVLYLNLRDEKSGKTWPVFRVYDLVLGESDLKELRALLKDNIAQLTSVLKTKNAIVLPMCREWKRNFCSWAGKPGCCATEGK